MSIFTKLKEWFSPSPQPDRNPNIYEKPAAPSPPHKDVNPEISQSGKKTPTYSRRCNVCTSRMGRPVVFHSDEAYDWHRVSNECHKYKLPTTPTEKEVALHERLEKEKKRRLEYLEHKREKIIDRQERLLGKAEQIKMRELEEERVEAWNQVMTLDFLDRNHSTELERYNELDCQIMENEMEQDARERRIRRIDLEMWALRVDLEDLRTGNVRHLGYM